MEARTLLLVLLLSLSTASASFIDVSPKRPLHRRAASSSTKPGEQSPAPTHLQRLAAVLTKQRKPLQRIAIGAMLFAPKQLVRAAAVVPKLCMRGLRSCWNALPAQLPAFWRAHGLTKDGAGQVAFMLSNVAYLYAGVRLLLTAGTSPAYGVLMLTCCAASCAYHASQCLTGCGSEETAKTCTIDTVLAVTTGIVFMATCPVEVPNVVLGALSLVFFEDRFSLGYTTSHSLWHFSTAAAAVYSGESAARKWRSRRAAVAAA